MSALVDVPVPAAEPVRTTDSAALALEYADRLISGAVRDIHQAMATRVLPATRLIGGGLPERIHSAASNALYSGLSTGMRGSASGLRALARRGVGAPLEESVSGRQLLSTINAMVGAELAEAGDPGGIRMAFRVAATDVPVDATALAAAFPQATGRIVLFLHGLGENDESWQARGEPGGLYATHLAARTDWTALVLRYNTGLSVSDNGAELSALISRLSSCWPVPLTSISLVGHSMGGLLARSATVHALAGQHEWVRRVTSVVCLGTPHLGAQLEKAVLLGARALALVPESAPFAPSRSVVLRHGHVTRDEWKGHDVTARWGEDRIAVAPLVDAAYHFVAATMSRGTKADSADHVALLNHPLIADWLVAWLQRAPDGPAPGRTDQDAEHNAEHTIGSPGRHRAAR